jgi:ketosteroid isomerase-like protein
MANFLTVGFRENGNRWEVAHEHSSLPIDHASGQMVFGA